MLLKRAITLRYQCGIFNTIINTATTTTTINARSMIMNDHKQQYCYSSSSSSSSNKKVNNGNNSNRKLSTSSSSSSSTTSASTSISTISQTTSNLSSIVRSKYKVLRENNNPHSSNYTNPSNQYHQQDQSGSRTRFRWEETPKTVLIVKKHKDKRTTQWLTTIAHWLTTALNLRVLVEPNVHSQMETSYIETYTEEESHMLGNIVDFVITLGGDGTLLHVSSLFKEDVPPIISFHLGTLGFLMPFNVEDYQEALTNVMKGDFLCTNRMRLICDVYHKQHIGMTQPSKTFQVLNEVTIHRGSNPHSTVINCTINGHMLTDIVGDGLIVATATGSTAYSLSCGGPMVHPCINCIVITPIAPSSLSSKPALLPDDSILKLNISQKGKSFTTTFDGTRSIKMEQGEHIIIRKSFFPLLTINKTNETTDWVHGNGKLIEMSERSSFWNQNIHTTSAN